MALNETMNKEVKRDYTNLSLDEMIRDKFKQLNQGIDSPGISPLFRNPNPVHPQQKFFQKNKKQRKQKLNVYSNYLRHIAKKSVQQARRKLDLRRRLTHLRMVKQKVDLRYKIIANMLASFNSNRSTSFSQQKPLGYLNQIFHQEGNGVLITQPQFSTNSIKQIEGLVGELPPWLMPSNSGFCRMTTDEFNLPARGAFFNNSYQSNLFGAEHISSNLSPLNSTLSSMPSLEFAPISRPAICNINRASEPQKVLGQLKELSEDYSLEKISIQVPNDEKPPRKITLNERFTVL